MRTKKSSSSQSSNSSTKSTSKKTNSTSRSNVEPALRKLFIDELKDIFWAEKHLTKALPKMKKASGSMELSNAIEKHLEVTKSQVERLEQVFELLGEKAVGKKCEAMEGLVKEGESVVEDTEDGSATRDAGIIVSSQKIEHYEIASYGSLKQLALTLGEEKVAKIFDEILNEEKEADSILTRIAEENVNYEAAAETE